MTHLSLINRFLDHGCVVALSPRYCRICLCVCVCVCMCYVLLLCAFKDRISMFLLWLVENSHSIVVVIVVKFVSMFFESTCSVSF